MAQTQPMSGNKIEGLSNVTYDLVTVLANCGEAIDALGDYIQDAQRENSPEVAKVFQQIRDDDLRHCDMLRNVISEKAKQGKF